MREPRVSVIVPTHNRARLLGRALASVRAQTLTDWELIVVNDASTDDTASLLRGEFACDRLRVIETRRALGPAHARNLGIEAARGEYVAFLDDDDEWLPRKLELQLATLAEGGAVLAHTAFLHTDRHGNTAVAGLPPLPGAGPLRDLVRGNYIGNSTVVARTAAVRAVGSFDTDMPFVIEDWDLWLRLARTGSFVAITEPLARINHTDGSVSSRTQAREAACRHIAARFAADVSDRSLQADLLYALGLELMQTGSRPEGRRLLRASVRARPWPRRLAMTAAAHLSAGAYGWIVTRHTARVRMQRLGAQARSA